MSALEKFMGIAFTLIALGLVLKYANGFNTVVTASSKGAGGIISQLQNPGS